MADIVDIAQHLPVQDPELIEYLVSLVAEARNGRLTGFAMIYIDGEGGMHSTYLLRTQVAQMAVQAFIDFDAVHKHFE